jgi:hypothetical protein
VRLPQDTAPRSAGRRRALAALGAAAVASLAPTSLPAAARAGSAGPARLDLDDPETRLEAIVKLRGSLDPRPIWVWLIGRRYAITPDGVLPLCSVYNCSIVRWQRTARDRFDLPVLEFNFNTDFVTGEWRDELVMPVTGRAVKAPAPRSDVVRHKWKLASLFEGTLADAKEFSDATLRRFGAESRTRIDRKVHGPEWLADEVAFTQDWLLRVEPAVPGIPTVDIREIATVRGLVRDVADPKVVSAPSRTAYSIVYGLPEWTQLQHVPGHVLTSGVGGKASNSDELPAGIRQLLALKHPEALGNLERLLPE